MGSRRACSGRGCRGLRGTPASLRCRQRPVAHARAHIATVLHAVFERISASGTVPDSWRRAVLVPIYKKGDHAAISNYRPLSVLPGGVQGGCGAL